MLLTINIWTGILTLSLVPSTNVGLPVLVPTPAVQVAGSVDGAGMSDAAGQPHAAQWHVPQDPVFVGAPAGNRVPVVPRARLGVARAHDAHALRVRWCAVHVYLPVLIAAVAVHDAHTLDHAQVSEAQRRLTDRVLQFVGDVQLTMRVATPAFDLTRQVHCAHMLVTSRHAHHLRPEQVFRDCDTFVLRRI